MKKSIDFSSGVRGKHAEMDLQVLGAAKQIWAVCVAKDVTDLIPFKIYRIETYTKSDEVKSTNEKGKTAYYPKDWFAPVEISKKTEGLLKEAA